MPRPSEATAGNVSIQLAIQKVYPALVRIYAVAEEPGGGRMERQRSAGSGVIVSSGGYVVTNHHVAGNAVRLHCTFADGEEVAASRVGTDPLSDVAVLKLKLETRKRPGDAVAVATWGDSSRLKVGDVVLAMGSPMALSQSVTQGIVSNTQIIMPKLLEGWFRLDGEDVGQIVRWIGHDAVIFSGNSGGPLVNLRGEIVGINELELGSLGGAIPGNLVRNVVDQLIQRGRVSRSWLGVEFQPRLKGHRGDVGALVAGVVEGSPADKAGIKAGDVVIRFHGQPVNAELPEHVPLINQRVFATPVGEAVEVAYLRDGKDHVAKVTTEDLQRALKRSAGAEAVGDHRPRHHANDGLGATSPEHQRRSGRYGERGRRSRDRQAPPAIGRRGSSSERKARCQRRRLAALHCRPSRRKGGSPAGAGPIRARNGAAGNGRYDRAGREPKPPGRREQTVVQLGYPGLDSGSGRAAGGGGPTWRSGDRRLQGEGRREGRRQGGRHHLGRQRQERRAHQPGDREVFDTLIRRLRVGREAVLTMVRDGKPLEVTMVLEAAPPIAENAPRLKDVDFGIVARELSYMDRVSRHIPEDLQGVLLQTVESGGWASLGGLHGDDIVVKVDGKPTPALADFKRTLDQMRKDKPPRAVFFVRRGIHTLFCEIEPDYR